MEEEEILDGVSYVRNLKSLRIVSLVGQTKITMDKNSSDIYGPYIAFDSCRSIYLKGIAIFSESIHQSPLIIDRSNALIEDLRCEQIRLSVTAGSSFAHSGTCIFARSAAVRVINSVFKSLHIMSSFAGSETCGAGIYITGGTLVVEGSQFLRNQVASDDSRGGAICALKASVQAYNSTFIQSVIVGNSVALGGAIYVSGGDLDLTQCDFENITLGTKDPAGYGAGGAIYHVAKPAYPLTNSFFLSLSHCNFKRNRITGISDMEGGAVFSYARSSLVKNCLFESNSISHRNAVGPTLSSRGSLATHGAGLKVTGHAITLVGSVFKNNLLTAPRGYAPGWAFGGGAELVTEQPINKRSAELATMNVLNNVFFNNSVVGGDSFEDNSGGSAFGGGLRIVGFKAYITVSHNTFQSNSVLGGEGPSAGGTGAGGAATINNLFAAPVYGSIPETPATGFQGPIERLFLERRALKFKEGTLKAIESEEVQDFYNSAYSDEICTEDEPYCSVYDYTTIGKYEKNREKSNFGSSASGGQEFEKKKFKNADSDDNDDWRAYQKTKMHRRDRLVTQNEEDRANAEAEMVIIARERRRREYAHQRAQLEHMRRIYGDLLVEELENEGKMREMNIQGEGNEENDENDENGEGEEYQKEIDGNNDFNDFEDFFEENEPEDSPAYDTPNGRIIVAPPSAKLPPKRVPDELYYHSLKVMVINNTFIGNSVSGGAGEMLGGDAAGGALYFEGNAASIIGCYFTENWAIGGDTHVSPMGANTGGYGRGGAFYLHQHSGAVLVRDSDFEFNSAIGGQGYREYDVYLPPVQYGRGGRGGMAFGGAISAWTVIPPEDYKTSTNESNTSVENESYIFDSEGFVDGETHRFSKVLPVRKPTRSVIIELSRFKANSARGGRSYLNSGEGIGGAIWGSKFQIQETDFNSNRASSGGAVYGVELKANFSTFTQNVARSITSVSAIGGAVSAYNATITNSIFRRNMALADDSQGDALGGAIHTENRLLASECQFLENVAYAYVTSSAGGAIAASFIAEIDNSTFKFNEATARDMLAADASALGGAVFLHTTEGGTTSLSRLEIFHGIASSHGGAIYLYGSAEDTNHWQQLYIFNNSALKSGGGIAYLPIRSSEKFSLDPEKICIDCRVVNNTAGDYGGNLVTPYRNIIGKTSPRVYPGLPFFAEFKVLDYADNVVKSDTLYLAVTRDKDVLFQSGTWQNTQGMETKNGMIEFPELTVWGAPSSPFVLNFTLNGYPLDFGYGITLGVSINYSLETCPMGYRLDTSSSFTSCQRCLAGLYGFGEACIACPDEEFCARHPELRNSPPSTPVHYEVQRGFQPSPHQNPIAILECPYGFPDPKGVSTYPLSSCLPTLCVTHCGPSRSVNGTARSGDYYGPSGGEFSLKFKKSSINLLNFWPFSSLISKSSENLISRSENEIENIEPSQQFRIGDSTTGLEPSKCPSCKIECETNRCAHGYTGFLCSKCVCPPKGECFYPADNQCHRCMHSWKPTLIVLIVALVLFILLKGTLLAICLGLLSLVVIGLTFASLISTLLPSLFGTAFIIFAEAQRGTSSGLIKSFVFFLQTVSVFISPDVLPKQLARFSALKTVTQFHVVGLQCLSPTLFGDPFQQFLFSMLLPIFLLLVLYIAYWVSEGLRLIYPIRLLQDFDPLEYIPFFRERFRARQGRFDTAYSLLRPGLQRSESEVSLSSSMVDPDLLSGDLLLSDSQSDTLSASSSSSEVSGRDREGGIGIYKNGSLKQTAPPINSYNSYHYMGKERFGSDEPTEFSIRAYFELTNWQIGRVALFLVFAAHFELCNRVLEVFAPCVNVATEKFSYSTTYPWLVCHDSNFGFFSPQSVHGRMAIAGLVFGILYVIGVPAVFATLLYWKRQEIRAGDAHTNQWLGLLYNSYRPSLHYFELVWLFRRVAFAAAISVVPPQLNSHFLAPAAILVVSLLVQRRYKPFISKDDNNMEVISLLTILFVLVIYVSNEALPGTTDSVGWKWINFILIITVMSAFVYKLFKPALLFLRKPREDI